jgi:hypothetical protein
MKYALAVASLFWAGAALAQAAPVIAPNGEYLGMAVKNGATTVFVDRNGQYGGAVVQNRAATAYFGRNGYEGVAPNVRPPRDYMPGGYPRGYSYGYGRRRYNGGWGYDGW